MGNLLPFYMNNLLVSLGGRRKVNSPFRKGGTKRRFGGILIKFGYCIPRLRSGQVLYLGVSFSFPICYCPGSKAGPPTSALLL
jgi:hypothetical protein